jgi:hypothetical protein
MKGIDGKKDDQGPELPSPRRPRTLPKPGDPPEAPPTPHDPPPQEPSPPAPKTPGPKA